MPIYNTPGISVRGDLDMHVYTHWNVVRCICKALAELFKVYSEGTLSNTICSPKGGAF
jgi:hypothetical protein